MAAYRWASSGVVVAVVLRISTATPMRPSEGVRRSGR